VVRADTKKVAQTETIWAILVNSSTPIESKVTQKILVMSREMLKKNRIYVKLPENDQNSLRYLFNGYLCDSKYRS
jgi:hypothetical protein